MIDVQGEVALQLDGAPARLVAEGSRIRIDTAAPDALVRAGSSGALRTAARYADRYGVTIELVAGGRTMLVAGRDVPHGLVSRLARLERVHVPLRSVPRLWRARRRVRGAHSSSA